MNGFDKVTRIALQECGASTLEEVRERIDGRVMAYVEREFRGQDLRLCGLGPRSEEYDRLAFDLVIRQEATCERCARSGMEMVCPYSGKRWEVFTDGDRAYVWYRPGLCQAWLRARPRAKEAEAPVTAGARGFGR